MTEKLDGLTMDLESASKDKLRTVFPECFTEGRLDIDKLLSLCGEYITDDFEKYEFKWKGKSDCLRLAQKRSTATLRPVPGDSVNWDTTQNLYIEGDNLEVLKLLQKSYFRKVKMIYIDPPYNTGNDFVYEDDFADPLARYKEVTAQTTKSNPETMGRYHTNWLNMMYPRLRLAANLLRDDGFIFISVDDVEQANMRKLCDEVFGEENFRNCIAVRRGIKNVQAQFDTVSALSVGHEYIYLYSKQSESKLPKISKEFDETKAGKWDTFWRGTDRPTMRYELFGVIPSKGQWRWEQNRAYRASENYQRYLRDFSKSISLDDFYTEHLLATGYKIDFVRKNEDGTVQYYVPPQRGKLLSDNWMDILLSGSETVFDTEKNVEIIERIIRWITTSNENDIILDFFSGSATTAHAVMRLNALDEGNRHFVMVQLPEMNSENSAAYKEGFENICELGKDRIRRAGKALADSGKEVDIGFKVFRLDSSNLKLWDDTPIENGDLDSLFARMDGIIDNLKPGRSEDDLVYEILLKMGYPLTADVASMEMDELIVYTVERGGMLICLQPGVTAEIVEKLAALGPQKIVLAENALADNSAMSNAHYLLENRGIELKLV